MEEVEEVGLFFFELELVINFKCFFVHFGRQEISDELMGEWILEELCLCRDMVPFLLFRFRWHVR